MALVKVVSDETDRKLGEAATALRDAARQIGSLAETLRRLTTAVQRALEQGLPKD